MLLDKILFKNLGILGRYFLNQSNLGTAPSNIDEMHTFLETIRKSIEKNEFPGILVGNIFFSFVSNKEIRDRNTTSRVFEDIFSSLFDAVATDKVSRKNPVTNEDIDKFDVYTKNLDWKISSDISTNKREKSDLDIGSYQISLKTLKGPIFNENNICEVNSANMELNIGSFSYRALLKGILPDEKLNSLGDRKSGLGSSKQLRENVFNEIKSNNKQKEFLSRLSIMLPYVYEEDIYIVLKSHYQIKFILIPNDSFVNCILKKYEEDEENFETIINRWENNNLRIKWKNLLQSMDTFNLNYREININLDNIYNNKSLEPLTINVSNDIKVFIQKNLQK